MQKFLFIAVLFIGFSTFFASSAKAQNTVRLQSEASVTIEGIYIHYSNGWSGNVMPDLGQDYLMPNGNIDIPLSSGGRWEIKLWDGENIYFLVLNIDEYDNITYVTLTDDLLRRSISN
ncbi:hypothetical protein [Bernardetia sp.]|uniref:hypothetical protein n=1 Tax=Bernardetia sp. TaxID=1937974 RepID=UPI0025C6E8B4|nr:hypothetical protein [Bernardetia sp.]